MVGTKKKTHLHHTSREYLFERTSIQHASIIFIKDSKQADGSPDGQRLL